MTIEEALSAAFLIQARSDFSAYRRLVVDAEFPCCHALHYLQMAAEKLGKAIGLKSGWLLARKNLKRHDTFVPALRLLWSGPLPSHLQIDRDALWARIQGMLPLAHEVERLAPDLAGDGPNAEYPWGAAPSDVHAPARFDFPVWSMLKQPKGIHLVSLVHVLLEDFEQVFG